jgi:2-polyprenyl-6-methoxyphenol hydroxylase-like FAD-dependent oxidoreductase
MTPSTPRALVIGAGIGGLTAALALRRAGLEVAVFERAAAVEAAGAGIWIWPNAIRALDRLGHGRGVVAAAAGVPARSMQIISGADGSTLAETPTGEFTDRFGAPLVVLHRADLHAELLGAVGEDTVRTNAECVAVEQDGQGATACFADGTTERADLITAADGIRSGIRRRLWDDGDARFTRYTAWRAITPTPPDLEGRLGHTKFLGPGGTFGVWQLPENRVFWFGSHRAKEGERHATAEERKAHLLSLRGDWPEPIPTLIEGTPATDILRHDTFDRPPLRRWVRGRVALLGDAARPMQPNLGQGACQAIEDALFLGAALAGADGVVAGLRAYERARRPRAAMFVRRSARLGRVEHFEAGLATRVRNRGLRRMTPETVVNRLAPMIGDGRMPEIPTPELERTLPC